MGYRRGYRGRFILFVTFRPYGDRRGAGVPAVTVHEALVLSLVFLGFLALAAGGLAILRWHRHDRRWG